MRRVQIANGVFKTEPRQDSVGQRGGWGAPDPSAMGNGNGGGYAPNGSGRGEQRPYNPNNPMGCRLSSRMQAWGCWEDNCGNVWFKTNGRAYKISAPDTIRERPLAGYLAFASFDAGAARTFSLPLAPDVPYYVARRLVVATGYEGGLAIPLITTDYVTITDITIGNKQQLIGQVNGAVGGTLAATAAVGFIASTMARDSMDMDFEFDLATPSLGLTISGDVMRQNVAATNARISFTFMGFTFESLSHGPPIHLRYRRMGRRS